MEQRRRCDAKRKRIPIRWRSIRRNRRGVVFCLRNWLDTMETNYPIPHSSSEAASVEKTAEFEALLQPVLKTAYGTAFYLARSREDAEDLLQESAVLAFRAFDSFERGSNFKAWFGRVLHNRFLERVRSANRRPQTVSAENDEQLDALYLFERTREAGMHGRGHADPAGALLNSLDNAQIRGALSALPDEFRVVAALYFVEELSYEQIAQVVECPLNTVRSRLHRSRRLLQRALWELAQERGMAPQSEAAPAKATAKGKSGQNKSGQSKGGRGAASWLLMLLFPLNAPALSLGGTHKGREHGATQARMSHQSRSHHVQNPPFRA